MKKLSEVSENFNKDLVKNIENLGYLSEAKKSGDEVIVAEFKVVVVQKNGINKITLFIHNDHEVVSKTCKPVGNSAMGIDDSYNKAFEAVKAILKK